MRFGVLGPLAVWTADGRAVRVPEAKVRALLGALVARAGEAVSVDRLVEDLWGDAPPGNPANSLQTKVSQLRRALELAEPGARDLLTYEPAGYRLRVDDLDATRFTELVARAGAVADPGEKAALLSDALALWRGPAFADVADADFARAPVTRLTEARLSALEDHALARLDLGEHTALADDLAELIDQHPLRERLRAAHLRALYRSGRQGEALDSYEDLRKRLADELGADPGPELVAVHRAILNHDPALAPAPRPRTNLPAPVGELIGRDADVDAVRAALTRDRLVTLTGPGGVGKTRLALAVAHELSYPDGVWLVELAAIRPSPDAASPAPAEAIAAALGMRDEGGRAREPVEHLTEALRGRELLLVLDNCEHVVESVAKLASVLLREVPGLRVLATSREPLAISGELAYAVAPLSVDDDAVRLFLARSGLTLDEDNAAAVAAICRGLDGIPLALELAAARVRAFGVHGLARRLGDRFHLLGGGGRDAPARQRTLRAAIDWSWDLLTDTERTVLRRIAWHADGCTADSAAAVTGMPDALDVIVRLVDRSFLVVVDDPDGTRYRLLESVAAYGLERLRAAGEADEVAARYSAYFTELAETAEVCGREQRAWLLRLEAESANLARAFDDAVERGDADTALRLVDALAWSWFLRGRHRVAHRFLDAALAVPGGSALARARVRAWLTGFAVLLEADRDVRQALDALDSPDDRAQMALFLSYVHVLLGDAATGAALLDGVEPDDDWNRALLLAARASVALLRSDLPAAERDALAAHELFAAHGDGWGRLRALESLAVLAQIRGDYPTAARLHRESTRIAEDLRLWNDVAYHLSGQGRVAMLTGDHATAVEFHHRAMRLAVEQSDTFGEECAEVGLALVARRTGRLDDAERHLLRWLDWNRSLGSAYGLSLLETELGFVAELRGDPAGAAKWHRAALASARETGDPRSVAFAVEGLAGACSIDGEPVRAARLLGAAAALRESVDAPLPSGERADVDRIEARLRSALGDRFAVEYTRAGDVDELTAVG
ncbi:BTAD domain-containing putative transcriptional regulator [Actinokineospora fastidiosa]|uniref:SARP family transcriptional regulator n=1 Tax=Actinokineospora fastidiosa TaxID=1816 RepID=A0A918GHJ4_9PSEU|nr:BTAD domain-containing putative transcriptional regulator [Actinokineospora fastidiosa]GGS36397.1 SARP family transcriptional regulator [Actinokineospora fastidiosa]